MSTLNISLPDSLRKYIEEQTQNGGYSTVSEYVRTLIREDQKRKDQDRLESLLLEGLESGDAQTMSRKDWEEVRHEVRKRLGKRHRV